MTIDDLRRARDVLRANNLGPSRGWDELVRAMRARKPKMTDGVFTKLYEAMESLDEMIDELEEMKEEIEAVYDQLDDVMEELAELEFDDDDEEFESEDEDVDLCPRDPSLRLGLGSARV